MDELEYVNIVDVVSSGPSHQSLFPPDMMVLFEPTVAFSPARLAFILSKACSQMRRLIFSTLPPGSVMVHVLQSVSTSWLSDLRL